MKAGRPKLGLAQEQLAHISHLENLPEPRATITFRAILEWLVPPPQTREAMVALFDGKVKYGTIRSWRNERRRPPQWAVDVLDRKLATHIAAIEARRQALPHCAAPPTSPA